MSLTELNEPMVAIVGILNLQVIVAPDGDSWIAQAIELDYAAGGTSPEDAKRRFEAGLCATLQENLNIFGNLDNFLENSAPVEDWLGLVKNKGRSGWKYSQVSFHEFEQPSGFFPFKEITYLVPEHG